MQLHIATIIELVGAVIGIVLLGILGGTVTPRESETPRIAKEDVSPEQVIEHAQEGYQLETCVRDISSRTVLGESASGAPEIIVLEGAPVTECFPGLEGFRDMRFSGEDATEREKSSQQEIIRDGRMATSVTVLPLSSSSTPIGEQTPPPTEKSVVEKNEVPPLSVPASPTVFIPSGGGGSGWIPSQSAIPPLDRFDTCRTRLFGETIPNALTEEEYAAFETCLLEVTQ